MRAGQLTAEQEELEARLLKRTVLQGGGETGTLENRYQVIDEANQFQVQSIGVEEGG